MQIKHHYVAISFIFNTIQLIIPKNLWIIIPYVFVYFSFKNILYSLFACIVEIQISKLLSNLQFQISSSTHFYLSEKYDFWSFHLENYLLSFLVGFCRPYFMHTSLTTLQTITKEHFKWKRSETQLSPLPVHTAPIFPCILHMKLTSVFFLTLHLQIIQLLTVNFFCHSTLLYKF